MTEPRVAPSGLMPFPCGVSDRLAELLRQRALLQEHLAWLDREIAALRDTGKSTDSGPGASPAAAVNVAAQSGGAGPGSPIASVTVIPSGPPAADADAIIQRYGYDPRSTTADVKRGCWIAFIGAFVCIALLILAVWFLRGPD